EVTGLTVEFLADKPLFEDVVDDFLAFVGGAELVIHNAAFDIGFLDAELARVGPDRGCMADHATVLDSPELARQRYPGQRNSLDALCRRLGVDNAHRQLHGALLDAQLLAEVYLALTAGQGEIGFGTPEPDAATARLAPAPPAGPRPRVAPTPEELALHAARVEAIAARAGRNRRQNVRPNRPEPPRALGRGAPAPRSRCPSRRCPGLPPPGRPRTPARCTRYGPGPGRCCRRPLLRSGRRCTAAAACRAGVR